MTTNEPNSRIKFIHLRLVRSGGLLYLDLVRSGGLLYPDELEGKGGLTVAYRHTDGKVSYAIAMCNTKDNYCKAKGRMIATGRLLAGRNTYKVVVDTDKHVVEQILSSEPLATIRDKGPL